MGRLHDYFADGEWYIAIRKHLDVPIEEQKQFKVTLLKNTWRYWCADPFVFEEQGKIYIFMEVYDKIKQRGFIGYRIVEENGSVSKIRTCLDIKKHMSYPFIFRKTGNIYMLPECYQSNRLAVYRAEHFPDSWVAEEVLLDDVRVCDSNILEQENDYYLTTMMIHGMPYQYDQLSLYHWDGARWMPSEKNPVVSGAEKARNGGAYFYDNGRLLRPTQNCSNSYGENLSFQEVKKLSPDAYVEEEVAVLNASDVIVRNSKKKFDGIHTFNTNGKYDVVDLRISKAFQPAHFLGILYAKIGKLTRGK